MRKVAAKVDDVRMSEDKEYLVKLLPFMLKLIVLGHVQTILVFKDRVTGSLLR